MADSAAWLVEGDDDSLVASEVRQLVARLAGGQAELSVEDFRGDEVDLDAVVTACLTPPFLVERRVVVLREVGRYSAEDLEPVIGYLADPSPTTALVLAAGQGKTPPKLVSAVRKVGEVVATGAGRDTRSWIETRLRAGPVRFDSAARATLSAHLGQDVGRVPGLLDTLAAAYGEGASVGREELEPYLGEAGSVAPWDLTDAIDAGQTEAALGVLHRLLGAGEKHPMVILAILYRHVLPVVTLDGSGATTERAAAEVLGIEPGKSTYGAKKALATLNRWGSDGAARALQLVAGADLDLRGDSTWRGEIVLEVLVARLCRIVPRGSGGAVRSGARAR